MGSLYKIDPLFRPKLRIDLTHQIFLPKYSGELIGHPYERILLGLYFSGSNRSMCNAQWREPFKKLIPSYVSKTI